MPRNPAAKTVRLTKIWNVTFGPTGTVKVPAIDPDGNEIAVIVELSDLHTLVPRLSHALTVAALQSPYPEDNDPVPVCLVPVADANAFSAKDTQEPGLTLHTPAGLFQFCFPPAVATAIGTRLRE